MLEWEHEVYAALGKQPCLPRIHAFFTTAMFHVMAMDRLGQSLESRMRQQQGGTFDRRTALKLGVQMVRCVETVHRGGYIHGDLKPDNFLMGHTDRTRVFLVDFGLSTRYIDDDGRHVEMKMRKSLSGTPRYASIHNHKGCTHSRRDDLEALGYILVYFVKGRLPWQSKAKGAKKADRHRAILKCKEEVPLERLCDAPLKQFLEYTRALKFTEEPDYDALVGMLEEGAAQAAETSPVT